MVNKPKILLESCTISNQVLRLTGSIQSNPLPAPLAHGLPVAPSNDGPAMFGNDGPGLSSEIAGRFFTPSTRLGLSGFWHPWQRIPFRGAVSRTKARHDEPSPDTHTHPWRSHPPFGLRLWTCLSSAGAEARGLDSFFLFEWLRCGNLGLFHSLPSSLFMYARSLRPQILRPQAVTTIMQS